MSEGSIFRADGETYRPTGHARGPWSDTQLHGGAPAALIVREIERLSDPAPGVTMAIARLTCEFLGPVPLAPLTVRAEVVKPGKRLQLVEAEVAVAGGPVVLRARAVRLRRGDVVVPPQARGADASAVPGGPDPELYERETITPFGGESEGFHLTGMELRPAIGSFATPGPACIWLRPRFPLVDGESASPVARVAMAADFGNGVSGALDFRTSVFVNTDLTVHLHRQPAGEWVLLDARTAIDQRGIGLAHSQLFDEHGAPAISAQSLYVENR